MYFIALCKNRTRSNGTLRPVKIDINVVLNAAPSYPGSVKFQTFVVGNGINSTSIFRWSPKGLFENSVKQSSTRSVKLLISACHTATQRSQPSPQSVFSTSKPLSVGQKLKGWKRASRIAHRVACRVVAFGSLRLVLELHIITKTALAGSYYRGEGSYLTRTPAEDQCLVYINK